MGSVPNGWAKDGPWLSAEKVLVAERVRRQPGPDDERGRQEEQEDEREHREPVATEPVPGLTAEGTGHRP